MKLSSLFEEIKIDNTSGAGVVPNNTEVDYFGVRVLMKPSVFLKLAAPLPQDQRRSVEGLTQYIKQGGAIASPWLRVVAPSGWVDGDFSQPAEVYGHEGRNRMYAVINVEGDNPIEVHIFLSGRRREWRARHITPDLLAALNSSMIPEDGNAPIKGPFFSKS